MSPSPPYVTLVEFTAGMQLLIAAGMVVLAIVIRQLWRRQVEIRNLSKELGELGVEHAEEHRQLNENLARHRLERQSGRPMILHPPAPRGRDATP